MNWNGITGETKAMPKEDTPEDRGSIMKYTHKLSSHDSGEHRVFIGKYRVEVENGYLHVLGDSLKHCKAVAEKLAEIIDGEDYRVLMQHIGLEDDGM